MYIADPLEQLEAWQERIIDEYTTPDGQFVCCGCRQVIAEGQCRQIGAGPHGLPACERCYHEAYAED